MTRRTAYFSTLLATTLIAATSFVLSDTPDKMYLNPYFVDIVVTCAGGFLLWDAWHTLRYPRLAATLLRAAIGASILTIHLMQFILDMARYH